MRTRIILGSSLILIVIIISVMFVFFFQGEPEAPDSKTFTITDSEQWLHEALGEIDLLIVTYEKEQIDDGPSIKTIQIIQTQGELTFVNDGEWRHNGEVVALSTNHDSNFTVNILNQHYLEGGLVNLRYNIIFGYDINATATFSFNTENLVNCSQAWEDNNLVLCLSLN